MAGQHHETSSEGFATVTAKIIRADGTEEDLGVISSVPIADAEALAEQLRGFQPADPEGPPSEEALEEANRRSVEANDRTRRQLEAEGHEVT
jgi:hypothetical protein